MTKKVKLTVEPKWGKYLRGPAIYLNRILKNENLTEMKKIPSIKVKLGITTGNNSFFYLNKEIIKKHGIESEFVQPLLKGPRDINQFEVDLSSLKGSQAIIISKDKSDLSGKRVLNYIKLGEEQGVNKGKFFKGRTLDNWYKVMPEYADIVMPYQPNLRHFASIVPRNVVIDKQLVCILVSEPKMEKAVAGYLNSTVAMLLKEVYSRSSFGLGSIQTSVTDIQSFPILKIKDLGSSQIENLSSLFDCFKKSKIKDIFSEIGNSDADAFDIKKVPEGRSQLDDTVFELIGLNQEERVDVYKSLIRLVSNRISRSQSTSKKSRNSFPEPKEIAIQVIKQIDKRLLCKFPESFLDYDTKTTTLPIYSGYGEVRLDLYGYFVQVNENRIQVENRTQAQYVLMSCLFGERVIRIPSDRGLLKKLVSDYNSTFRKLVSQINSLIDLYASNSSYKSKLSFEVFKRLGEFSYNDSIAEESEKHRF